MQKCECEISFYKKNKEGGGESGEVRSLNEFFYGL